MTLIFICKYTQLKIDIIIKVIDYNSSFSKNKKQ